MLCPADLAAMLGLTSNRVYQMISAGLIPTVRIGRAIRIPRQAWEDWLATQNRTARASLKDDGEAADASR